MSYAGFWKRFAAAFIDLLITSVLGGIAGGFSGFLYSGSTATFGAGLVGQIARTLVVQDPLRIA